MDKTTTTGICSMSSHAPSSGIRVAAGLAGYLLLLAGCSRTDPQAQARLDHVRTIAASDTCALIEAAWISNLLGVPLEAVRQQDGRCLYRAGPIRKPYVEVRIIPDDGKLAMMAAGVMRADGKVVGKSALKAGDQSARMGDMWMIRRGEDLVTILSAGIQDDEELAIAVYREVDKRLGDMSSPLLARQVGK